VLHAVLAHAEPRAVVVVTSDKCYRGDGGGTPLREDDPLGGEDPYSASKAAQEHVAAAYRTSYGLPVATARAGNVVGGGDWSEDRLVPDFVRSLLNNETLVLRSPRAVRPWQHVLDALGGYLVLAQALWSRRELAGAWNFAPDYEDVCTVEQIVTRLGELLEWSGTWVQDPDVISHEAASLRLDASLARDRLGWKSRFALDETLVSVADWYRGYADGRAARELVDVDLDRYLRLAST
jgi:CDP-glucose 4,6-dehydratase